MTESKQLMYECADGTKVPIFEADYDMSFTVLRNIDKRGSILNDPRLCIEAKALCRLTGVKEAYVGSGGDAFVIFHRTATRPFLHALHLIIPTRSGRVRDAFDVNKGLRSQNLMMRAPSKTRTLAARRITQKKWREAVKNGKEVKRRPTYRTPTRRRLDVLGVHARPRAKVDRGVVSIGLDAE